MFLDDKLDKIQERLDLAKTRVSEIELTNDKSRRQEWRGLNAYIKWAEHIIRTYRK